MARRITDAWVTETELATLAGIPRGGHTHEQIARLTISPVATLYMAESQRQQYGIVRYYRKADIARARKAYQQARIDRQIDAWIKGTRGVKPNAANEPCSEAE
jgi:hypothetical protein